MTSPEKYIDVILQTAREIALESGAVHPHDIMSSILTTVEVFYKQSEHMTADMIKPL